MYEIFQLWYHIGAQNYWILKLFGFSDAQQTYEFYLFLGW